MISRLNAEYSRNGNGFPASDWKGLTKSIRKSYQILQVLMRGKLLLEFCRWCLHESEYSIGNYN